jgi:hypothetical protein
VLILAVTSVSEAHTASIFRVEVCRMVYVCRFIFLKNSGGEVGECPSGYIGTEAVWSSYRQRCKKNYTGQGKLAKENTYVFPYFSALALCFCRNTYLHKHRNSPTLQNCTLKMEAASVFERTEKLSISNTEQQILVKVKLYFSL